MAHMTSVTNDSPRARRIFRSSRIDASRTQVPSARHRGIFGSAQQDIATSRSDVLACILESSYAPCEVVPAGVDVSS